VKFASLARAGVRDSSTQLIPWAGEPFAVRPSKASVRGCQMMWSSSSSHAVLPGGTGYVVAHGIANPMCRTNAVPSVGFSAAVRELSVKGEGERAG
jgi:hypothetical protein